jgi:O-acetyl-ADP-ribose deacetylase (regulator of RNase III)
MVVEYVVGDMFESGAQAYVVPVNCQGTAGAGLAKQFKKRYPRWYREYRMFCKAGNLSPGFVLSTTLLKPMLDEGPDEILSFPTKTRWRWPAQIQFVEMSMHGLLSVVNREDIKSVAMPHVGCGLGGLKWKDVKAILDKYLPQQRALYEVYEYTARADSRL